WGADRRAAVCRELTKTYEEVRRGSIADLCAWAGDGVRGEVTLVVEGASQAPQELTDDEIKQAVLAIEAQGSTRRDAVDVVAAQTGLPRRRVYNAAQR
ncbi:MAG: 16S rRNA (cytidine(1402)-2'-O)-methyltransferase, partial [Actinomycetes bacterium]